MTSQLITSNPSSQSDFYQRMLSSPITKYVKDRLITLGIRGSYGSVVWLTEQFRGRFTGFERIVHLSIREFFEATTTSAWRDLLVRERNLELFLRRQIGNVALNQVAKLGATRALNLYFPGSGFAARFVAQCFLHEGLEDIASQLPAEFLRLKRLFTNAIRCLTASPARQERLKSFSTLGGVIQDYLKLDSKKLKKALKAAGGKQYKLNFMGTEYSSIGFNPDNQKFKVLQKALINLKALPNHDLFKPNEATPLRSLEVGGQLHILVADHFKKLEDCGYFTPGFANTLLVSRELDPLPGKNHAIVLSGGLDSRKDAFPLLQEMILYAFLGFTVISVDDSKNEDMWKNRRVAIHTHLTKCKKFKSQNILWKGVCFSGPKMLEIASLTGGFFVGDQTSNDIAEIATNKSNQDRTLAKTIACYALNYFTTFLSKDTRTLPNYGRSLYIHNDDDTMISEETREKLQKLKGRHISMKSRQSGKLVHGAPWWLEPSARDEFCAFLRKLTNLK